MREWTGRWTSRGEIGSRISGVREDGDGSHRSVRKENKVRKGNSGWRVMTIARGIERKRERGDGESLRIG